MYVFFNSVALYFRLFGCQMHSRNHFHLWPKLRWAIAISMAKLYNSTVRIRLPSAKAALAMKDSLDVDEELQPAKISRELTVDDMHLVV